ncbi:CDP-glucose 4,6-dehydratase [Caulobacter sp. Root1455]|uniref:CDP-glucose 4,6-dehydratase n=1 Tax=unclassified Caulobacter TaxID=2648921 RepID=UPI00070004CE|nr:MULTISPECIES: CDP-glucose 4,6-dehydratase [unclassified Caulobacter]KQY30838.1 CDP-glucose 4,6-dehydratase [Caulobacter sp. Root487D2Y]KQY95114.1 CDP-glucose 4,6-dehydratase [Caulobacter sp. Root1455]
MTIGIDEDFWRGRRVLLTGHTGFKGGWMSLWLERLGATVRGVALAPDSQPNLFEAARIGDGLDSVIADVRDPAAMDAVVLDFAPSVVIHMAAQPLVRRSYEEPRETFATNLMGTVNLLDAVRRLPRPATTLIVTTDKVYENLEHGEAYREGDRLGGRDPYSASKACAELAVKAYFASYLEAAGAAVGVARAGNVIGGGDWSRDRLLPDVLSAFARGEAAVLRNPGAVRPWQHVLEPLYGYLLAVQALAALPGGGLRAWNFGPDADGARSVGALARLAADAWGEGASLVERVDPTAPHEAGLLTLNSDLARSDLGWRPRLDLEQAVALTTAWWRDGLAGRDPRATTLDQIDRYAPSGAPASAPVASR